MRQVGRGGDWVRAGGGGERRRVPTNKLAVTVVLLQSLAAAAETEPVFSVPPAPGPATPSAQGMPAGDPQLGIAPPASGGTLTNLPGGIEIWSSQNAKLVTEKPLELALGSAKNTPTQQVLLTAGELRIRVPATEGGPETALLVRTPGRAAFVVRAGAGAALIDGKTAIFAAFSGQMLTGTGARWRPLRAGSTLSFSQTAVEGTAGTLDPAPTVTLDRTLATAVGDESIAVRVQLRGSASRHRVVLLRRGYGEFEKVADEETSEDVLTLLCSKPGTYWVTASPIGTHHLLGLPASFQRLLIVGLVPPGSGREAGLANHLDAGPRTLSLRPNQSIEIQNPEELEMSYATPRYFAPASSRFSLAGEDETLVWLRQVGGSETLALRLTPYVLNAVVSLDPRNAVWPGRKVLARVRFVDSSGHVVTQTPQTRVTVSINARPTRVSWSARHQVLESWIPQPVFPGPWVIRVEVLDTENRMLGRNFMEVASAQSSESSPSP